MIIFSYFAITQYANYFDIKLEILELKGDNYKVWRERVLLHLGCMDFYYAIRKDKPPAITTTSTLDVMRLNEQWERSNCLSIMFVKTHICAGIRGSMEKHVKVRDLLKAIDEQFAKSDKFLASILIIQFLSLRLTEIRGVRDHIMHMMDISAQLKSLEVSMSESFLVHYILCTLPPQYSPFKISYNTHKDKWSINELLTTCVQEEEQLLMEQGEKVLFTIPGNQRKNKPKNNRKGKV